MQVTLKYCTKNSKKQTTWGIYSSIRSRLFSHNQQKETTNLQTNNQETIGQQHAETESKEGGWQKVIFLSAHFLLGCSSADGFKPNKYEKFGIALFNTQAILLAFFAATI